MREMTGSWLSGPASAAEGPEQQWRGERLGLPESGAGALAPLGVRVGALLVDWLLAYATVGVAAGLAGGPGLTEIASWAVPVVWAVMGAVCVWLFAQTPGQAVLGLGVARVDARRRVGLWRAAVRVVVLFLVLPPLIQNEDGRGMHDRMTGTALIRTR